MGFLRLRLLNEFGIGKEARQQRKAFLRENGGYKGLRKTLFKQGTNGINQKISSFKNNNHGRPGQNGGDVQENPRGDQPDATDPNNPSAENEWDKKSEEAAKKKINTLESNPKYFKKFEAENKSDAIKEINNAFEKRDTAKLRGIIDKALGDKLSTKEKLDAYGLGKKGELVLSGKANDDGQFRLYRSKDKENHFLNVEIQDDGSFRTYPARKDDKKRDELADKLGSIKSLDQLKSLDLLYKEFKAENREDAIKQINEAHKTSNQPNSAGILDKALDAVLKDAPANMTKKQKDEFKLKELGFPSPSKGARFTDVKNNQFQIYLNGDHKNAAGLINIQEDGSFKYQPYTDAPNETNSQ